jgi:HEAT repeat protein
LAAVAAALCGATARRILTSAMKKRKLWIIGGVLLAGCFGLSWAMLFRPFEGGPRYKGLPLSYWRKTLDLQRDDLTQRLEIFMGLRNQLGYPAVVNGDPAAVPVLVRLWQDDTSNVGIWMLLIRLEPTSPRDFVSAVVAQSQDRDAAIRKSAVDMLGYVDSEARNEAIAGLIDRLDDEDDDVRMGAVKSLGVIGPAAVAAVPSLVALLSDESLSTEAAKALREIDPDAARRTGIK